MKRKSYTAKFKLEVINEYKRQVMNNLTGIKTNVSKNYRISIKMLNNWLENESALNNCRKNNKKSVNIIRKLGNSLGRRIKLFFS
jgi:hypothetical protein